MGGPLEIFMLEKKKKRKEGNKAASPLTVNIKFIPGSVKFQVFNLILHFITRTFFAINPTKLKIPKLV